MQCREAGVIGAETEEVAEAEVAALVVSPTPRQQAQVSLLLNQSGLHPVTLTDPPVAPVSTIIRTVDPPFIVLTHCHVDGPTFLLTPDQNLQNDGLESLMSTILQWKI